MKKILFATTAIAGLATIATPAMADALEMDLGGFYRGYGLYADQDTAGDREFDLRHDAEVHFTGETTLDNGLTVGVHSEMEIAEDNDVVGTGNTLDQDEIYAYMEGTWGRVNWGQEDGAAYLLQVAAPSADSNVDGLRTYIQGVDVAAFQPGYADGVLDYAQDYNGLGEGATKITYLTPKFGGFQAGASYAPEVSDVKTVGNGTAPLAGDDTAGEFENLWEVAARFDGAWDEIGFSVGGGYGSAHAENEAGTAAGTAGSDDFDQWNAGLNLQWMAFELGGAYIESSNGVDDGDSDTWTAGLGWNNGPWTAGASYLDRSTETAAGDADADRWTVGGTYTYGPGMTFRGAVAFGDVETAAGATNDYTQVTLGTEINF